MQLTLQWSQVQAVQASTTARLVEGRLKSPPPDRSRDLQHSCGATLPHPAARLQPQHEQRCAAPALAPRARRV